MLDFSREAEEIRRRMHETRRDLQIDAHDMRQSASSMTDWRNYVRLYPWPAVGLAVAAGYLLMPSRRSPAAATNVEAPAATARRGSWITPLLSVASGLALKIGQTYAAQHIENLFARQTGSPADQMDGRSAPVDYE